MGTFSKTTILITGASGGIGEAIARAFHGEGAHLILTARNVEKLQALQRELPGTIVIPADLSDETASLQMLESAYLQSGNIDILINNAAGIIVSPAFSVESEDMIRAFKINVCAPLQAIQYCYKRMKLAGHGNIINIGSPGFMMGIPFYAPYVASKAGFSAITRSLQAENEDKNIHICEYFPGYVATPNKAESRIGDVPQDFLMKEKKNIFTRPQQTEQIARQILKLARRPKALTFSSASVRFGAFLSLFPSFRIRLSKNMAKTARSRFPDHN